MEKGCVCDLNRDEEPTTCVLDTGDLCDCAYAMEISKKHPGEDLLAFRHKCPDWKPEKLSLVFRNVETVSVLLREGTDLITIVLEDRTAFPDVEYRTNVHIDTQQNKGIEWCKTYLGVEPTVIDARTGLARRLCIDPVKRQGDDKYLEELQQSERKNNE
jgi:hypothetical protein